MTSPTNSEVLARTVAEIGDVIEQERDPGERTAGIAAALRGLWPDAALTACLLREGDHGTALDASGRPRPEWDDAVRAAAAGATAPKLPGPLTVAPLTWRGRALGHLLLALSNETEGRLNLLAQSTAAQLAADELQADLAAEAPRADVGELAGPLIHDVTNLFNNLLLNLTVLEQGGDLASINVPRLRGRVEQVTALIKEVQDYRRRKAPSGPPADLNAAAREAVALLNRDFSDSICGECPVALEPGTGVPPVAASRADLVRALTFLLKSAARAAHRTGKGVRVRTLAGAGTATFRAELPGVRVPVESQSRLYDTLGGICPGISSLELAASKSIARRFNGRPSADCPADGALTIQLEVATT
jgi:hypothetical protein